MKLRLKNGRIIEPSTKKDYVSDILIINGVIDKIKPNVASKKDYQIIDLKGKIITSGFIDMHVHLREPGYEYKETIETGCLAAAAGGFTAVCCMPNTNPAIDDASIAKWIVERSKQVRNHIVDVYPIAAITKNRDGKELSPMMELVDAGVVGFSDDGNSVESSELLRRAMEYASMLGKPIIQHSEDMYLSKGGVMNEGFISTKLGMPPIPSIAETIIIARDIQLANYTRSQYHSAHISTEGAVELIGNAKRVNNKITCEVTPHHFSLTDSIVCSFDTNTKVNPPLRSNDDVEALKEGLKDGTIDVIASDHAPHSFDEKQIEYLFAPSGIVGLETSVGLSFTELVWKNYLDIYQLIEKYSVNPRKILHLPPIKIIEGEEANLTIIDPELEWTVDVGKFKSKSKNSPFNGRMLKGKPIAVLNHDCMFINGSVLY